MFWADGGKTTFDSPAGLGTITSAPQGLENRVWGRGPQGRTYFYEHDEYSALLMGYCDA